jgi:thiol-disulfide isomerase/thioredoxin
MLIHAICLMLAMQVPAQSASSGIVGSPAPPLSEVQWVGLGDAAPPAIRKGEVTYLFFFQSWCPGCHSHGFPTLKALEAQFKGRVDFIPIQTVFEGFGTNTPRRAARDVQSFGLNLPVGHDGDRQAPSPLLRAYRGGGTPWTVIIDRQGIVRFNGFRLPVEEGKRILTDLVRAPAYELLPEKRGGQELVGTTVSPPAFGSFSSPLTLYRWWTDTCPYCDSSLPALDTLREKYAGRGLRVVGVYHPKPPSKKISSEDVQQQAAVRHFGGDVVIDRDWSQLRKWWLDTGDRGATSMSFLVDANGVVRFVHPGPVLFPSNEKKFAQENRDFQLLDRAIDQLLPKTDPDTPLKQPAPRASSP